MSKYVIRNEETGALIAGVGIGCRDIGHPVGWARFEENALHFELEEAEATINFINDVIDWELAHQLTAEPLKI